MHTTNKSKVNIISCAVSCSLLRNFLLVFLCFLFSNAFAQHITYDAWQKFSEQSAMPAEVKLQKSNNNLDIVKYKHRYYVAFRTAPSHFASVKTRLYVVSSPDLKKWDFETEINTRSDSREPRFTVWGDSLYLYYFKGGTKAFKFEPQQVFTSASSGDKKWTSPLSLQLDGYVPWRLRKHDNTLLLSAYYGKDLYK